MAPERAPAFQFYPKDFLSDGRQGGMSLVEAGAYVRLLCHCWLEQSIPDDAVRAAYLVGATPTQMRKLWPVIRACFREHPDQPGRLVHPRLEKERDKQEAYRQEQSRKGKASAANRASTGRQPESNRASTEQATEAQPKPNSPISYLRSPDKEPHRERACADESLITAEDKGDEAARFIDRYRELYTQHRHGARLRVMTSSLQFTQALELLQTWDFARLEKLAVIFLTTDEQWISQTDRGFGVFHSKASWCDDRLAEWDAAQKAKATA